METVDQPMSTCPDGAGTSLSLVVYVVTSFTSRLRMDGGLPKLKKLLRDPTLTLKPAARKKESPLSPLSVRQMVVDGVHRLTEYGVNLQNKKRLFQASKTPS